MSRDPRLTPAREDLAAEHLRGEIAVPRYAAPRRARVARGVLPLRCRPGAGPLDAELLYGTEVDVYEEADGLAWVQSARDGYVGYVPSDGLMESGLAPTHRVAATLTHLYPGPDLKAAPLEYLPLTAELSGRIEGDWLVTPHGCVPARHVAPVETRAADWVAEAERFLGVPYLWGGSSALGIDCSALIQVARHSAGHACPRDSDMQAALGEPLPGPAPERGLRRGDLVFWRGHVGVMRDAETLLHANAHHMAVASERLAEAVARIAATETGGPTFFRRWPA
ncbi:MAG: C40 family peptidase [Pseudomonadota bacterium]